MKRVKRHILALTLSVQAVSVLAVGTGNRITARQYLDVTGSDATARTTTTYYDGLGRERMRVAHDAGINNTDISWRTDYDSRGNVGKRWLPVPGGSELLTGTAFDNAVGQYYGSDEIAYTRYLYDETGMNRQNGEYGPGLLWTGHGTSASWHKNEQTGDYSCLKLTAEEDGTIKVHGMYEANTLSVIETEDGDTIRTLLFKNRVGNTVMKRRIGSHGTAADTRYIYDIYGDLRCALSPEGSRCLPSSGYVSSSIIEDFGQRFDYDIWHRCISSKVPGCGAVHYVYNRMDAVCFESTAEQRAKGEWTLTKYDSHRRPAVRGVIVMSGATRESLQAQYGDSLMQETFAADLNKAESTLMYSNNSGPAGFYPYIAWYYDNYDFMVGPNATMKPTFETSATDGYTQKTMCTGTAQVENGSGTTWYTAVKYNHRGQPTLTCRWDLFLQSSRHTVTAIYDFVGNETQRTEKIETMAEAMVTGSHQAVTRTDYDSQGRPVKQTVTVDNNPEVTLTELTYDALGRPASETGAVTVEYDYDIRSNVTDIVSERFAQKAWYGQTPTQGAPVNYSGINALRSAWFDGQDAAGYYSRTETYTYDELGRYKSSVTDDGDISETIAVDLDANVTEIQRYYNADIVQDAVLTYDGGKAVTVYDNSDPYWSDEVGRFAAGEYELTYDSDGRLTSDATRAVKTITYHPFGNLPKRITMDNEDYIHADYLPDGTLIQRQFTTKTIRVVTTITADGDTIIRTRPYYKTARHTYSGQFEKTSDGWIYHTDAGYYDLTRAKHYWYLRDRLGSTVAVVDVNGNYQQTTAYYPSGTPYQLPNVTLATAVDASTDRLHIGNKWMSHSGLNMYDNTARMHDPILMRFATPDPLYGKYPDLSPWSHCAANPVNVIDPSGMDNWQLDDRGYFTLKEETKDDFDVIFGRDEASINVEKGFIKPIINGTYKSNNLEGRQFELEVSMYSGSSATKETFEFFAKNSNVEWSIFYSQSSNIISTSHFISGDTSIGVLKEEKSDFFNTITRYDHSHPDVSYASPGDIGITKFFNPDNHVEFNIFLPKNSHYVHFTSQYVEIDGITVSGKAPKNKKLQLPVKPIKIPSYIQKSKLTL